MADVVGAHRPHQRSSTQGGVRKQVPPLIAVEPPTKRPMNTGNRRVADDQSGAIEAAIGDRSIDRRRRRGDSDPLLRRRPRHSRARPARVRPRRCRRQFRRRRRRSRWSLGSSSSPVLISLQPARLFELAHDIEPTAQRSFTCGRSKWDHLVGQQRSEYGPRSTGCLAQRTSRSCCSRADSA